jgi:hypothetical protein
MTQHDCLIGFIKLGEYLRTISKKELEQISEAAYIENRWFSASNIEQAIGGLGYILKADDLKMWMNNYQIPVSLPKTIGIVMAGNIPLVGFHDLLCVLLAGHRAAIKASSQDSTLIKFVLSKLTSIDERFEGRFDIVERLKEIDAVVATGSDNTARYFEYYFGKYPNIIRKNRISVAVLDGTESNEDLHQLGHDVFDYFGLGCRNVSKILLPENYELPHLLDQWKDYESVLDNQKYRNNYDYNKSILLVNQEKHLDTGFSLLQQSTALVSPISVTYYQRYDEQDQLNEYLSQNSSKIQCIVSNDKKDGFVPFGKAQLPELWDYADNVDTLAFLEKL